LEALEAEKKRVAEAWAQEAARAARQRELNVEAHFDELSKAGKALFRRLSNYPSFDVNDIASLLRLDWTEAWERLLELAECNTVLEIVAGAVRAYNPDQPYIYGLDRHGSFRCRGTALRQMRTEDERRESARAGARAAQVEAEAVPLPKALPEVAPVAAPPAEPADPERSQISRFIAERCSTDPPYAGGPSAVTDFASLRSTYIAWCESQDLVPLVVAGFTDALSVVGFAPRAGRVRGVRLRLAREASEPVPTTGS
jgi:hypothetical protein